MTEVLFRVGRAWWRTRSARRTTAVLGWLLLFQHSSNSGRGLLMLAMLVWSAWAVWRRVGGGSGNIVAAASHRRRWRDHAGALGLLGPGGQPGRVEHVEHGAYGQTVTYRLLPGQAPAQFAARADELAHAMGAREVRVSSPGPGRVTVRYLMADPLNAVSSLAWPLVKAEQWDLSRAVPVGIDEDGEVVTVPIFSGSVLLAGSPGSGKSAAMWLLVLAALLDPRAVILLVDAKGGVEFSLVGTQARVVTSVGEAVEVIENALAEVARRYEVLRERGARKVEAGDPTMPPIVIMVDELAEITGAGTRESKAAGEGLRRLVATGRAAGITVVGATQKPSSDVVPTGLRDLFATRVALRCGMRGQAETIAPEVAGELTAIPASQPGTGYLVDEAGRWRRFRAWYLPDEVVRDVLVRSALARRA